MPSEHKQPNLNDLSRFRIPATKAIMAAREDLLTESGSVKKLYRLYRISPWLRRNLQTSYETCWSWAVRSAAVSKVSLGLA